MRLLIALLAAAVLSTPAMGDESLIESVTAPWRAYVFVSSLMPRDTLISLAKEASLTNAVLVLNGFGGPDQTLQSIQKFAVEINNECCQKRKPEWLINPPMFDRYKIKEVPAFVIAHGDSADPREWSKVSGDIDMSQALKNIAQDSEIDGAKNFATQVYYRSYGSKY